MADTTENTEIPDIPEEQSLIEEQMFGLVDFLILGFLAFLAIYWLFLRKKDKSEPIKSFSIEPNTFEVSDSSFITKMKSTGRSIIVFYGSQTGTAEEFATRLAKEANRYRLKAMVADPEEYDMEDLSLFCWYLGVEGFCPFRCLCNEDTLTVWCDGAALDVVPITLNPVLQELHLNGNKIKGIAASFTVYQNLRYLDMSQNLLTSLGSENFAEQKELLVLHLNSNKITELKSKAFHGLSNLKVLRLDGNLIEEIADDVFEPLYSLENLDLSRNRISVLSSSAFSGLGNLKELLLRDNRLTRIPTDAFQNVGFLRSLDLGMNFMYVVPKNSFQHLRHLQVLSLDGCGIHIIEIGAFLGLDNIVSLFLQDNELQNVPTDVLMDIPYLQELHVGKNKLQTLGPNDFRGLRSLRTITVNGEDDLQVIENGTFADNHQLERLIISHNKILHKVEMGTFRGLDNLRFLSLRGNQFTTFHEDMLPWDKLDVFDVRDNPLTCNCSVLWLWHLLKSENFTTYGEDVTQVVCSGPVSLKDRLLVDVSPDDMDCDAQSLKQILAIAFTGAGLAIAVIVIFSFWHRYKYAANKKNKLGQSKRTLYQYGQNSENFSPILAQQPFKNPAIAEL